MCVSHCHPNWADVLGYDSCALDLARYYKWRISAEHCDAKCIMFDAWMFGFLTLLHSQCKSFFAIYFGFTAGKNKIKTKNIKIKIKNSRCSKNDPNQN